MDETSLLRRVETLKETIKSWAMKYNLWEECGFKTYDEHFNDRTQENPCVLVLWSDGELSSILSWHYDPYDYVEFSDPDDPDTLTLEDEFSETISTLGFCYEMHDRVTACFYPKSEDDCEAFRHYYDFLWICQLMAPDFSNIHTELFEHFHHHPDDLHRLDPRKFERLVEAVFRNNGYRTELGPGWSDGGIDLRLYQNDILGELVTIVQVKRNAPNRPIRLESVQALTAIVDDEKANRGLFVTTSRFLPSVKKFAKRQDRKIQLATSSELQEWCQLATIRMRSDTRQRITSVLQSLINTTPSTDLIGTIVRATWGYNTLRNDFCVIVAASSTHVLLQEIPSVAVSHDGYGQRGIERPRLDSELLNSVKIAPFVASRSENGYFWGQQKLFRVWDGEPVPFDHCD